MAIPTKPKNIPATANWDKKLQLWAQGETRDKKQVGEWKWWRKHGELYAEATYNDLGQLHGEYFIYHTDGRIFDHSYYVNGVLHGTQTLQNSSSNSDVSLPRDFHWQVNKIEFIYNNGFHTATKLYNLNGRHIADAPANVPKTAIYNSSRYWVFGEKQRNKQVGKWQTWRADGNLLNEINYSENGQLHGAYKVFHPNGEIFQECTYAGGRIHGTLTKTRPTKTSKTDQSFPWRVSGIVHKIVETYNRGNLQETNYFTKEGIPCNYRGKALPKSTINDAFGGNPVNFLDNGLKTYLKNIQELKPTSEIEKTKAHFKALWGIDLPEDLEKALDLFEKANYPKILSIASCPIPLVSIDDDELNVVEEAILNMQTTFPADNIVDWFTGSICIDKLFYQGYSKSYSYQYGLFDTILTNATDNQIYKYNYNSPDRYWGMDLTQPVAKDLSSLLMIFGSADAYDKHSLISNKTFTKVFDKTKSLVNGDYYTFQDIYNNHRNFQYYNMRYNSSKKTSNDFFNNARWLLDLLKYNSERPNYSVTKGNIYSIEDFKTIVPRALFNLFATYFRKDDARNDQFIALAKSSPSRIIRDAGLLVEEFRNGRNELGLIKDLEALRKA